MPHAFLALLVMHGLARCLARQFDEQPRHFDEPRGSPRGDGDPPEVSQKETPVTGAVLPADVDRDVLPPEPRARGVADLPPAAGGVADDLRQQVVVVTIVIELA